MGWLNTTVAVTAMLSMTAASLPTYVYAQEPADELRQLIDDQQSDPLDDALPEALLLAADELDQLVAPVALYPDALLAQVLVAATYPLQVVKADQLLEATEGMSDDEVTDRIAAQEWDPSVMVLLSGFPTVVGRMADDLAWTERLGNAMLQQDDDVLAAVQRMRTEALETGYLTSNDAQVVEETDDQITILPADPEVVYVPTYDPAMAFTTAPTAAPYIAPRQQNIFGNPLVSGAIAFGAALLIQELFNDDEDEDEGWDDYWRRPQPIDWDRNQFYPRPRGRWQRDNDDYAWSRERDRYWDRDSNVWAYDAIARDRRAEDRRGAVAWVHRNPEIGRERARELRQAAIAHDRQAAQIAAERRAARRATVERREREATAAAREQRARAVATARERAATTRQQQAKAAERRARADQAKAAPDRERSQASAEQARAKARTAAREADKAKAAARRARAAQAKDKASPAARGATPAQDKAMAERRENARAVARERQQKSATENKAEAKAAVEKRQKVQAAAHDQGQKAASQNQATAKAAAENQARARDAAAKQAQARNAAAREQQQKATAQQQARARDAAAKQAQARQAAAQQQKAAAQQQARARDATAKQAQARKAAAREQQRAAAQQQQRARAAAQQRERAQQQAQSRPQRKTNCKKGQDCRQQN